MRKHITIIWVFFYLTGFGQVFPEPKENPDLVDDQIFSISIGDHKCDPIPSPIDYKHNSDSRRLNFYW